MLPDEKPDQEPGPKSAVPSTAAPKGRQSLSKVRRELSDEELATPAVQRMLIEEVERLESERIELREFRDRFYLADKRADILQERVKRATAEDIIFGLCLTVGSAVLGYAPTLWAHQPSGYFALIIGALLIVGAIAFRAVRR